MHVHYIPHYVPFEPWVAIIPLAGLLWGMAGALSCATAVLAGDAMAGMWGSMSIYRALASLLLALNARHLSSCFGGIFMKPDIQLSFADALRFILISVPGCFAAAACVGLGAEWHRLYPFPYVATITLMNHLVFLTVFGVVLIKVVVPRTVLFLGMLPVTGQADGPGSGNIILIIGAAGSYFGGLMISRAYDMNAFTPVVIGTYGGGWVVTVVALFILIHIAILFGALRWVLRLRARDNPR